jgi:hypothetical protein
MIDGTRHEADVELEVPTIVALDVCLTGRAEAVQTGDKPPPKLHNMATWEVVKNGDASMAGRPNFATGWRN